MSLADIIKARKAGIAPVLSTPIEDDDCFLLSGSSSDDRPLRALLHLVNVGSSRANLTANECAGLRALATWLGPFSSSHLPYYDKVPRLLQSFTMWQLGPIINIAPAKYWKVLLEVLIEAEKISLDKKSQF
jgi:hypothetical protein